MSGSQERSDGSRQPAPRLPSLFPKRDLTLAAGSQGNRRQFVPNLAAAGKRAETAVVSEDKGASASSAGGHRLQKCVDRDKKDRKKPAFDKHRQQPEIVQSSGIFVGTAANATTSSRDASFSRASTRPVKTEQRLQSSIAIKRERKTSFSHDRDEDSEAIKHLLADTILSDIPDPDVYPVHLPLCKQETSIKSEESKKFAVSVKRYDDAADTSCSVLNCLKPEESGRLVFLQLPNMLSDGLDGGKCEVPSSNHTLDAIPEGKVGKIQIFKSGKARFIIGNMTFQLNTAADTAFLQHLVSLDPDNGHMTLLGQVDGRLLAVPCMEELFAQRKKFQPA